MRRIFWSIIVAAIAVQYTVQTFLESLFSGVSQRFMLVLGTPIWRIDVRYAHSPLGFFLGCLAVIASFYAGGYAISYLLQHFRHTRDHITRLYHVLAFVLVYIVVYVLALGFDVPQYAHQLSFGETATWVCSAVAAFIGSYVRRGEA